MSRSATKTRYEEATIQPGTDDDDGRVDEMISSDLSGNNCTSQKNVAKSMLFTGLLLAGQLPSFSETTSDYIFKSAHDSITIPLTGGFKFFAEQRLGSIRAVSFCLPGETDKHYTCLMSIMSAPIVDSKLTSRDLAQKIIDAQEQVKAMIPSSKLTAKIIDASGDNDVLVKTTNGEINTTLFTRSLKGTDAIYQLQYQFHSAAVTQNEEQNAIKTLNLLSITSTAAEPFKAIALQRNPYEISSKTEALSVPIGPGWQIVDDRTREPIPIFQYANQVTVRTISLVPESDSLVSFAKMLKIEILPSGKTAMTPRQIMKTGKDSFPTLDGGKFTVIEDRSDNDVTFEATFSKPIDMTLTTIGPSDMFTRLITGTDAQYKISMVFPPPKCSLAKEHKQSPY